MNHNENILDDASFQSKTPTPCTNPPVWRMSDAPYPLILLLEHYDVESELGKKLIILHLEYEKKCSQARINMINEIKKLLTETLIK